MIHYNLFRKALSICMLILFSVQTQAREKISWNSDWGFSRKIAIPTGVFPHIRYPKPETTVNLPHTWNAQDWDSENGYYRGPGTYLKDIEIPESYKGKRLFLHFEGAGTVTTLFIDEQFVGEHKGAYNGFTFEITDFVKYGKKNKFSIFCDNTHRFDVAPQTGDFTMFGGIYRDLWLEVMDDDTCISPLFYGSKGVFVSQKEVNVQTANLETRVLLNTRSDYKGCEVSMSLIDAQEKTVAQTKTQNIINNSVVLPLSINKPHLWQGTDDPYLYKVKVELRRNGKVIDEITDNIGLRSFTIDADKGFFLNGKHVSLHGVSRHQEWKQYGSALKKEQHLADIDMMSDMGVNAIRMAHYPQSQFILEEADRRGFVVWEEIPFVGKYVRSDGFNENLRTQLREMIWQNYNHPSIVVWGLFNEVIGNFDDVVKDLNEEAKKCDPSRLTTVATYQPGSFNHISDVVGWNKYYGWYIEHYADMGKFFDDWHAKYPKACIAVSEYGGGANPFQHVAKFQPTDKPIKQANGQFHPEEWQVQLHHAHIDMINSRPYLWGTFVWNMFDFSSSFRREGGVKNINDKGLVSGDRSIKKDAYYLYRANWNKNAKTTHICSKRYTERKESVTDVTVISTSPSVTLYVNGEKVAKQNTDNCHSAIFKDIKLRPGKNIVMVKSKHGNDSCTWNVCEKLKETE